MGKGAGRELKLGAHLIPMTFPDGNISVPGSSPSGNLLHHLFIQHVFRGLMKIVRQWLNEYNGPLGPSKW